MYPRTGATPPIRRDVVLCTRSRSTGSAGTPTWPTDRRPGGRTRWPSRRTPAVPTHSRTWAAPPSVSSRTRSMASSPRSVTTSVAPKRRAMSSAVGVVAERDDPLGAEPAGGEHRAEADGPVAHDHRRRPGLHPGRERAVMARAHHVGERGERARRGGGRRGRPRRAAARGCRPRADAHGLALAAVVLPAPVAPGAARGLNAREAVVAGPVREGEGRDHLLAGPDRAHLGADRLDDAHELVAGAPGAAVDLQVAAVRPEVAPADAGVGDAHEGVGRLAQGRVRHLLHPDVAGPVIHARSQDRLPFGVCGDADQSSSATTGRRG